MRRAKKRYDTPDANGWQAASDDLFLAKFRGKPCETCGATHVDYNGRKTRSMGHHLKEKGLCRAHRYNPFNIVVLCANHHSRFARDMSPHSDCTSAQARFNEWLRTSNPEKYAFLLDKTNESFSKEWSYKEMYIDLGGEIASKTGFAKDDRPVNHAAKVRDVEGLG